MQKSNEWSLPDGINFEDTLMKDERVRDLNFFDYHSHSICYQSFDSVMDDSRSWAPSSEAKAESLAFFLKTLVKKIRAASGIDKYFSQYSGCASPFFGFSEDDIARREAHANLREIYQWLESAAMEIPDWLIPNVHGKRGFGGFQC